MANALFKSHIITSTAKHNRSVPLPALDIAFAIFVMQVKTY